MINLLRKLKPKSSKVILASVLVLVVFSFLLPAVVLAQDQPHPVNVLEETARSAIDNDTSFLGKIFSKVVGPIIGGIAAVIISLQGAVIWALVSVLAIVVEYNQFIVSKAVSTGWTLVRDVANMFIVLILMMIAIATILRIENYNFKRLLPKLLLMALLVNFSKLICGLLIDLSQVVMMTFVAAFSQTMPGALMSALNIDNIVSVFTSVNDKEVANNLFRLIVSSVLMIIMLSIAIGVIAVILAVLVLRIVMLWLLIVLSPLAYIMWAYPKTQSYAIQWWNEFAKYIIIGPLLAFFLWLSFAIVGTGGEDVKKEMLQGKEITTGEQPTNVLLSVIETTNMTSFVIGISLLLGSLIMTQQLGVAGGSLAGQMAARIRSGKLPGLTFAGKLAGKGAKGFRDLALETLSAKTHLELRPSKWKEGWETSRAAHRREREAEMRRLPEGVSGFRKAFVTPGHLLTEYYRLIGRKGKPSGLTRILRERKAPKAEEDLSAAEAAVKKAQLAVDIGDFYEGGVQLETQKRLKTEREQQLSEIEAARMNPGHPKNSEYNIIEEDITDDSGKVTGKRKRSIDEKMDEAGAEWGAEEGIAAWDHTTSTNVNEAGTDEEKKRRQAKRDFLKGWDEGKWQDENPSSNQRKRAEAIKTKVEADFKGKEGELEVAGRGFHQRRAEELEKEAERLGTGEYSDSQKAKRAEELAAKKSQFSELGKTIRIKSSSGEDFTKELAMLEKIKKEIEKLEMIELTADEKEKNKKMNQSEIQLKLRDAAAIRGVAESPFQSRTEREKGLKEAKETAQAAREEAARVRPAVNYELRRQQRLDINEEKKNMTTDSWQELVSIFEDAQKNGDINQQGAALLRLAETANENEILNWYGYRSDSKGLKDFTYQQLVGKRGMGRERARALGYSDEEYDRDFAVGGMSEEQALSIANDTSYTAEKVNHWGVARAVGVRNGRQVFQPEEQRLTEILAETRKLDFETFLRRANRLAFGYEQVAGDTREERALKFRAGEGRDFYNSPFGLAFLRENWSKFAQNINRGRFNINWSINLTSKTGKPEVEAMIRSMDESEKQVGRERLDKIWQAVQDFAGEKQQKEGQFQDLIDVIELMKAGAISKKRYF